MACAGLVAALLMYPANAAQGATKRSTADRPDAIRGYQIHVIYFVPDDAKDRRLDVDGTIARGLAGMQRWFADQSGGLRWRLDVVRSSLQPDITFVRGEQQTAKYLDGSFLTTVRPELQQRGFARADANYLVFFDGPAPDSPVCGEALYPIPGVTDYTPARSGYPVVRGFSFVQLQGSPGCKSHDWGTVERPGHVPATMMHELMHPQGLVAPGAPNTCDPTLLLNPGHVCTVKFPLANTEEGAALDPQRRDLMYPALVEPLWNQVLDIGNDDYFDAGLLARLDLRDSPFVTGDGHDARRLANAVPVADPTQWTSVSLPHPAGE